MTRHSLEIPEPLNSPKSRKSGLTMVKSQSVKSNLAYHVYSSSLAPSGRKSIASLLGRASVIMGFSGAPSRFAWHTIKYRDLQKIRSKMLELGYSVNTINLLLAALKGISKTAFNLEMMQADTLMRIQSVKSVKGESLRKGRSLTKTEIRKISNACKGHDARKARDLALIMVGCGVGLRCSEIIALQTVDIDLKEGVIRVLNGKGKKQRQVYISRQVNEALEKWMPQIKNEKGFLFRRIYKGGTISEKALTPNGVNSIIKSLSTESKIKPFTAHDMRRTFITRLLEKGVDLNIVRQIAGHSDVTTTTRYDYRGNESVKQAGRSVNF